MHPSSRKIARRAASSSLRLRIFLIEANPLAASFLKSILCAQCDVESLCLETLVNTTKKLGTAVFVVDANTLPLPVSQLLSRLQQTWDDPRIVVLDFPPAKPEWLPLLPLGIRGFVPYSEADLHLQEACQAVHAGKMWMSRNLLEQYVERSRTALRDKNNGALTERESMIVELVRQRMSNKEVAFRLQITESTVKFHLKNIFTKLQIHDRADLLPLEQAPPSRSIAT